MKRSARLGFALAAGTVVALGLASLVPQTTSPPTRGDEDLAAYRTGETARESEQIDARSHEVLARLLAKDRAIDALFRGELTLDQTVRRFREITETDPQVAAAMRARHGGTGDEMYYRNVLGFARGAAHYHPEQARVVLPRLEAEISRRFPPPGVAELSVR